MEKALTLELKQQQLLSILHLPDDASSTAVLIVVGGPQYRVGSHRQFLQLSRYLANNNIASLRFDYRGMGDSEGHKHVFDDICDDINVACDALIAQEGIKDIVIWGLCDAASAALLYAKSDPRISGLVLLNPWLQNEQAMAKTMVKFYYVQRLLSKSFWLKLLSGKVNVGDSLSEAKNMVSATLTADELVEQSYQQRMLTGAINFSGPVCLILSGNDLTAREFKQQVASNKQWQGFFETKCQVHNLELADHTFSSQKFKQSVEQITSEFILGMSHHGQ